MFRFITSAIVAGAFALTAGHDAQACGGGFGCRASCCAPAPAAASPSQPASAAPAATPDMPDMPPAAPTTAHNARSQYRSYSYDPAPNYRPPMMMWSPGRPYASPYRADHKIRGY